MQVHARSDRAAALLLLLTSFLGFVNAQKNWKYSTELTVSNFDTVVKAEIDAGKTMFVRWIASPT